MKLLGPGFALLLALWSAQAGVRTPGTRVLFVGNSLTYFHSLPSLVAAIADVSRPSQRVEVDMLAAPGASIRQHLDAGQLGKVLAGGKFEVVVLQEVGGFPLCSASFPGCEASAVALDEATALVRRHGARPIVLATYASPEAQPRLSAASEESARRLKVDWFDWGRSMADASARDKSLVVTLPDHHPAPTGSWLAALGLAQLISGVAAPIEPPAKVCAPEWANTKVPLDNTRLASRQMQPAVNCFDLSGSTYSTLRASIAGSLHRQVP